jgi:hypothetical protein
MIVMCFPGVRTEQLYRDLDNRDLGTLNAVVIRVGTNDLERSVNLDYVMGEVSSLVNTAKVNFNDTKLY